MTHDCCWCGVLAIHEVELEPAVYGTLKAPQTLPDGTTRPKGFKAIKRPGIKAWVCLAHAEMVGRNRREKKAREAAHKERLRLAREERRGAA